MDQEKWSGSYAVKTSGRRVEDGWCDVGADER